MIRLIPWGARHHQCIYLLFALLVACGPANSPAAPAASPPAVGAPPRQYAVLFDASHGETSGNADWVISASRPDPLGEQASPRAETDWTGAISAWGVALQRTGRY